MTWAPPIRAPQGEMSRKTTSRTDAPSLKTQCAGRERRARRSVRFSENAGKNDFGLISQAYGEGGLRGTGS
jgi:hypothetical protein